MCRERQQGSIAAGQGKQIANEETITMLFAWGILTELHEWLLE